MPNGMQPGNADVAAGDKVRRHEATHHAGVERPERGIIGLVAKAEAIVDHIHELLDRLERDGEVGIEIQIKLPGK